MEYTGDAQLKELLSEVGASLVYDEDHVLKKATRVAELLTKALIRLRSLKTKIVLERTPFLLPHFPVRNVTANGSGIGYDETFGIILPNLPLNQYTIEYEVGYKEDQTPAIVESLILNLAAYSLTPDPRFKEAATAEAEIVRARYDRLAKERQNGQTH